MSESPTTGPPRRRHRGREAYERLIALRLMRARKSRFLSVISLISVLGIIFGVASLNVVCSVSGGFEHAIRDRILGLYPHMVILKRAGNFTEYREVADKVRRDPHVEGATPATYDEMMAALRGRRAGVLVKGLDMETVGSVSRLDLLMLGGTPVSILDERPQARFVGHDQIRVVGLKTLGSYTVVTANAPDGAPQAFVVEDYPSMPDSAAIQLRLIHAAPGLATLQIELVGPQPPKRTRFCRPGEASPYMDAPAGPTTVRLIDAQGRTGPLQPPVDLKPDTIYSAVLVANDGAWPDLKWVSDPFGNPEGETARVRLLHLRPHAVDTLKLTVDGGRQPLPGVLPGETGDYALVPGEIPTILLASGLAEQLEARTGDVINLVSPLRGLDHKMLGPFGMAPSSARFRVGGLFRSGYYEHDSRFALVNFVAARRFLARGDIARWIEVRLDDLFMVRTRALDLKQAIDPYPIDTFLLAVDDFAGRITRIVGNDISDHHFAAPTSTLELLQNQSEALGLLKYLDLSFGYEEQYKLIDWEEMNKNLYSTLKLQKVVLSVLFLIIILVASFNVIGTQIMLVHEKTRDIAILRSMGARAAGIRRIFFLQGTVIGGVGTIVGLTLGYVLCLVLSAVHYELDPKVYLISTLPVDIRLGDILLTGAAALTCTFLASLYSANRAAHKTPVEGLRSLE